MIRVADFTVRPDVAASWLVERYPVDTVRFYDYAARENLDAARSPAHGVVLEDLGRVVCIGASLTFKRGHTLLALSEHAPWPRDDVSPLVQIREVGEEFYERDDVAALWNLFAYWNRQKNLGFGTVGKLMHMKWPHFVPITDDKFRGIYQDRAVAKHNASDSIRNDVGRGHRRTRANVRAYWSAFHDDLLESKPALGELRQQLSELADDPARTPADRGHVHRLSHLTDVRLLDALVWGLSVNDGQLDG